MSTFNHKCEYCGNINAPSERFCLTCGAQNIGWDNVNRRASSAQFSPGGVLVAPSGIKSIIVDCNIGSGGPGGSGRITIQSNDINEIERLTMVDIFGNDQCIIVKKGTEIKFSNPIEYIGQLEAYDVLCTIKPKKKYRTFSGVV